MNVYLILILLILISRYLLSLISDWLNVRHISAELPEEFEGYHDAEKYRLSQYYLRANTRFDIFVDTVQTAVTLVFVLAGGFNFIDRIAMGFGLGSIPTGLVFAGILVFAGNFLGLPFSIYSTFVIEQSFGFNRTTPRTFVLDMVKSWILTAIIGGAAFAAVLWFFDRTGDIAWIYCWAAVALFQFVLMFLAPLVILPLFNKFDPLEEGELKGTIESYAGNQDFKMEGVFKTDGSRRSSKSNAFFTGFGRSRRIVLFDTLIDKHSVEELLAIVAHEMGHYKKRHMVKTMIWSVMELGLTLFLLSRFVENEQLFSAFRMERLSVYASLFLFGFLYTPIGMAIGIIGNFMSRRHEFQADAFAVETCGNEKAMITGLKQLSVDNLSNLTPHPLKVFLSYSHPPVLERIAAIRFLKVAGFAPRAKTDGIGP